MLSLLTLFAALAIQADPAPQPANRPAPQVARLNLPALEAHDVSREGGLRFRPWVREEHMGELVVSDARIHDATDVIALHITATSREKPPIDGKLWTYNRVIVRNVEIGPVTLSPAGHGRGLHIDAIKADGSTEPTIKPELLVQDVLIHNTNGGVMTILCKDGSWGRITLRRVELRDTVHAIIIGGSEQHPHGDVLIDQCPGLRVAIQGDPGSVGTVTVRNSPGAVVENVRDGRGVTPEAKIVVEAAP